MGSSCTTPGSGYKPVAAGTQFTLTPDTRRSLQLKLLDLEAMIGAHRNSELAAADQVEEVRVVMRRHGSQLPDVLVAEYKQAQAMRETLARSRLAASNQALMIRTLLSTSQQLATLESVNALLGDVAGKFNLSEANALIATYRKHTRDLQRVNAKLTQAAVRDAATPSVPMDTEALVLTEAEVEDIYATGDDAPSTSAPTRPVVTTAARTKLPDVGQIPLDND